jgi:hypothetical protein
MMARSGYIRKNYVIQYERNFSSKVIIAVIIILIIGSLANSIRAGSPAQGSFVAGLTGIEEVPPAHTNATGSASFLQTSDGKMMYGLNVTGVDNVTKADVHLGKQGENGPIVLNIFISKSSPIRINGTVSEGNITAANLLGPMKGKQLSDLIDLFQHGDTYVNVATKQNSNGEIRGQIGFAGIDETGKALGEKNITADQGLQFD